MTTVQDNHIEQEREQELSTEELKKYATRYDVKQPTEIGTDYTFKRKIVWFNAIGFLVLHLLALYGAILALISMSPMLIGWTWLLVFLYSEGITIGAHRLYTHRTFKATFLLKIILVFLQTGAGENCLYIWVRDHRQHHKYSDTDADPHNANRGFFFSHIGWLMSKKHPAVIIKGKTIDLSDLEADPIVMFQKKYYKPLYVFCAFVIPVYVPVYFWGEDHMTSIMVCFFARYIFQLHLTWSVNSAAHLYGTRPFDKTLKPVESRFVAFITIGEGWHNYHHAFPWDYRASEYGAAFNYTAHIIDLLAYLGLAYDLKTAPISMSKHRALRTGDGSHPVYRKHNVNQEIFVQNDPAHNTD